ncbi:MAG: hypothetical protein F4X14_01140 [Caldilineaceae bacterium SB0661_bin_32]|uniref:Uncharacterized protein n=1 Tax=Caldilineaceae bacterium SB0661_bin_32 TaxID=2605255 RepID=A0A6B1D167_9CHLR|nr:hypothetical protein [Caldilineaceae bacterium SB0661_bin_32]
MAATEPPDKQDRGRSRKRRYFRRRRKGGQDASLAAEHRTDSDDARPEQRTRPKGQNRRRSENRRRSPRRRGSAARARAGQAQPAEEKSQPKGEVYIYTHVIRPTYREGAGGEFQADHSLNLSGATVASQPVGMEYLLESIGQQLDAWFGLPTDSTTVDNGDGEANRPDADSADDGGVQEGELDFAQETGDESTANDDLSPRE